MASSIGDVQRVSVAFTNAAGAAADPTTVILYVKKAGETSYTTYTYGVGIVVVKDSTGNYHADLVLDEGVGTWLFEWEGTGAVIATAGGQFRVTARVIAP